MMSQMTAIMLFHSVLGLRPAVLAAAADLRAAGHTVVTPDLYELPPVDNLPDGFALAERVGWAAMTEHARAAVAGLPADAYLAGISMGVGMVATLLPERPETAGVLLFSGVAGDPPVRPGLRFQVHVADPDPEYAPAAEVDGWRQAMTAAGADVEVFRYADVDHHWFDADLPGYDAAAATLSWQRAAAFLE
jgi:dienelactone hydrolase